MRARAVTSRRCAAKLAILAVLAFGLRRPGFAQGPSTVKPEDLAQAGPLGDVVLGSPDAKVTVIEYASMTCPHCADFQKNVFPTLKSKYIDTGKVRFILREFPLDDLATAGFMLARCAGNDKYYAVVDLLFEKQEQWVGAKRQLDALINLVKQAGFTKESAETCLKNQKIYAGVTDVMNRAGEKLGVNSTPTFFVNGQLQRGAPTVEEFDKILAPLVGS